MKTLILMFFLSVSLSIFTQNYIPMPDANAVWRESSGISFYNCREYNYVIDGDTIINRNTYHKLRNVGYEASYHPSFCNQVLFWFNDYVGCFRNDSANRIVYYVPTGQTIERKLFDFNANAGDTLRNLYVYPSNGRDTSFVIARVDSILLNNNYHRTYHVQGCNPFPRYSDSIFFIEGIGSNHGFLPNYECAGYWFTSLNCVKENNITIYGATGQCNILTEIEAHKFEQGVSISPNPSSGIVNIETSKSIESIQIYNMHGQMVKRIENPKEQIVLPKEQGLYLLQIEDVEGRVYTKKIVKQ